MKKFDTLISNYLYSNKKLDLEGIGSFWLDESFVLPPDAEKTAFFPLEGIHFSHNSRIETSTGLIDFLVQQSGKIRSLVKADFSSYLAEIKQYVNIGKPWAIEGIGTLQKNREGKFELVPGEALSERINMQYADETDEDEEPVRRRKWMVGFVLILAIIAVIAGLGFGVYLLFVKTTNTSPSEPVVNVFPAEDTGVLTSDTLARRDTIVASATDSFNYRVIHEITPRRQRALTRTAQLNEFGLGSHIDSVMVNNARYYRMFIYKNILPADTTRVRDSLSVYFGRKVRLERTR